jgi:hypothetical protein
MNVSKKHISPSQIMMFTRCGEQYRRRYIERDVIAPGIAQVKGTAIHKGADLNFRQKIDSKVDLKPGDVVDFAVATFEGQVNNEGLHLSVEEEGRGKIVVVGEAKDSTAKMAGAFISSVAPKYQPVAVEEDVFVELESSPVNLRGILDMRTDAKQIMELKTSAKAWNQEQVDRSGQLTFYSMLYRSKTGEDPNGIVLENIIASKSKAGEDRLRTETFPTVRGMDDYQRMIARLNAVVEAINKGIFPPAFEGWWGCSPRFCGYWNTCKVRPSR